MNNERRAKRSLTMTNNQHTQGPWHWNGNRLVSDAQQCMTDVVADVTHVTNPHDFCLIAAAPDLLAALDRLLSAYSALCPSYTLRDGHENMIAWDIANAAIAKARGDK